MTKNATAIPVEGGFVVKRTPGKVHATFDSAAAEAVRLTAEIEGPAFSVLKIVGIVAEIEVTSNG